MTGELPEVGDVVQFQHGGPDMTVTYSKGSELKQWQDRAYWSKPKVIVKWHVGGIIQHEEVYDAEKVLKIIRKRY